ncbi:hypothetical protein P0D88_50065 [Paraburkholderia sp. RL18-103-BIB-C]|uniref:hypothetical protein n=1 Tax=Paraburkholderia sp. RL18-103-BIB-C TaxID=3031637 RepID=UPI0038BA22A7
MDIEIAYKIGALLIGVSGVGKLLYDFQISQRGRMRDEYKFAREFLEEASRNSAMHPFLREKGYQAIAGTTRLTADEIEYLLSLKGAPGALKDYILGRYYLGHFPQHGDLQIDFKPRYRKPWPRRLRKWTYTGAYGVLSFVAFVPFIFSRLLFKQPGEVLIASVIALPICLPYAWSCLRSAIRIDRAEKLVANQDKHTQKILLNQRVLGGRTAADGSIVRRVQ